MNNTQDEGTETSLDMDLVASLRMKVSDTNFRKRNRQPTIFRVPDILKSVDPQAYEPWIVSLGPYHRDKPHLQAMNQLKWKCLKYVLEENPDVDLKDYVDRIKKLETQAREAYSEEVNMSSNNFVEMMLLDGCFVMLTIMGRYYWMEISEEISEESAVCTNFGAHRDIFVLENQLPFFLLETLYESAFPGLVPFRNLTFEFIRMHTQNNSELPSNNETFHHIIHLFLSGIDPTTNYGNDNGNGNQSSEFCFPCIPMLLKTEFARDANLEDLRFLDWIPSATISKEAGIQFERKKRYKNFLDVTFHNGKLEIPQVQIHDHTNTLLRNLIAYEQCSTDSNFHVTSYTVLMNYLIDTAADVELLQQHGIIIGDIGDSQEIATLFNKLGTNVGFIRRDLYLADVLTAMKKHHDIRCNKYRAKLNRDYFSNPWAAISLFGVLALFVLTVIQTTYTVLSYYRSSN